MIVIIRLLAIVIAVAVVLFLFLRSPSPAPPLPTPAVAEACPDWRWIGIDTTPEDKCTDAAGWQVSKLFGEPDTEPER